MREVTLVVGPPCAGKTTYVQQHALPDDIVIDWDMLAVEAGSPVAHDHAEQHRLAANAARKQLEQQIVDTDDVRAWIIRTLPSPTDRTSVMRRLRATRLEVIDPGPQTCLARAALDQRDPDIDAAILTWYGHAWGARCYGQQPAAAPTKPRGPNPRHTAQWRIVRKMILAGQPPCAMCGQPMLYGAKFNRAHPHPLYPTVDHIRPVADGGSWYDLGNLRPAHWKCNTERESSAGGRTTATTTHRTSEDW